MVQINAYVKLNGQNNLLSFTEISADLNNKEGLNSRDNKNTFTEYL